MTTLASRVAQLRKSGAIITARPSSRPVIVGTVDTDVRDFLESVMNRAIARNARVIAAAPPFTRGRDELVMARDECGRLKAKSAAGGKR